MKEQIVTGKKFRILTDVTSRLWHVISFWTKAQDVEFNDGTNAQSKLGNIAGISDSLTSTASNVAASAKAVKIINDKVVNQIGNLNRQLNNAQEGIDAIYNAIKGQGTTPGGKTPDQIVSSIGTLATNKYNSGKNDGYEAGKNEGSFGDTFTIDITANTSHHTQTRSDTWYDATFPNFGNFTSVSCHIGETLHDDGYIYCKVNNVEIGRRVFYGGVTHGGRYPISSGGDIHIEAYTHGESAGGEVGGMKVPVTVTFYK